jgi:hypothetical protein
MNVELPATVSQYAEAAQVSRTTVRRALGMGTLKADEKAKPTLIVEGDLVWTIGKWKEKLHPAVSRTKPHMRGYDGAGNLQILRGTTVVTIPRAYGDRDLAPALQLLAEFA